MRSAIEQSEMGGLGEKPNYDADTKALTRTQAIEIIWPYFAAAVCSTAILLIAIQQGVPQSIKDVFSATASAAGVFAGFMLTAAAILASIGDRPFIRRAKRAGVYPSLIRFLFVAMRWSIAACALSLPAMLFSPDWHLRWYPCAFWIWVFVSLTAFWASVRALITFAKLMEFVSDEQ